MALQAAEADVVAKKTGRRARSYKRVASRPAGLGQPLAVLAEPTDLVQAIVYSEIIGPPRALRPHGEPCLFLP